MNSLDIEKSSTSQKTKTQLKEELAETQERLKKQTEELDECTNKLQEAEIKKSELDELKSKLDSSETEKQNIQLVKKVKDLEKTIAALEKKLANAEKSDEIGLNKVITPKATFRIELYQREGDYQGRIDHPLTKDKKIFTGLDKDSIIEFISNHLPHTEELTEAAEDSSQLKGTKIIPVDLNIPSYIVCHDQTFNLQLKLDLTEINIKHDAPVTCDVSIYAKPFGGGKRQVIAETQQIIRSSGVSKIDLLAEALSEGTYLLEGTVTSSLSRDIPPPFSSYVKGGIIYVQ